MNKPKLNEALNNVEVMYEDVVRIADAMSAEFFDPIDKLISEIRENAAGLSPETIRDYMIRLQLRSYELSDVKEKTALKANCAEALRKETYSVSFNATDGTIGAKDNTATLQCSESVIIEALYNLVANRFKTKLDEIHRLIDTLKSILMSKMQEAKLAMNAIE